VERLLLLPLARAIASGTVRAQAILHLNERDGRVEITATRRVAPAVSVTKKEERTQQSLQQFLTALQERFDQTANQVRPLADRKSELLQQTQQPGFYQDAVHRTTTFDEIHKLDQFLAGLNGLGKALDGLQGRLERRATARTDEAALLEKLEQLSIELDQLSFVAASKNARDLGDALLCLSLVERTGQTQDGIQKFVEMYQALALRRRLTAEVLGEFVEGKQDCAYLQITGLGGYSLLKHEAGLHQLDRRFKAKATRTNREVIHEDREIIRVEVLALDGEPDKSFRQSVKSKLTTLKPVRHRIIKADTLVSLFHEPRLRSLNLWTSGPRPEALERALLILHGQLAVETKAAGVRPDAIIRHYELGLSPRIKDARTGRSTTHVERVLKGHLEALLVDPQPGADVR
jgi:hypothetical protein